MAPELTVYSTMDEAIRDCRRRAKREPENIQLQRAVDHLCAEIPEGQPWGYEKAWTDDWRGFAVSFVVVLALFCCGVQYHRAEPEQPAQQAEVTVSGQK